MSTFLPITEQLRDYILSVTLREPPLLERLREETHHHPRAQMQISPEQGQFMQLLVQLMGARRCIEVGVFTGYSSLAVALALPEDGQILACDVSPEYTSVARRYWKEGGVEHKVTLKLAPAVETLEKELFAGKAGTYDFAFIDADKTNYANYYELCLQLLRPGGLLAFDNTLWGGSVARAETPADDEDTKALRRLNTALHLDQRVTLSLVPIADGLTLCRKR